MNSQTFETILQPLLTSLALASITVVILLAVGVPLAWWLSTTRSRVKTLIESIVALPIVLPPTVLGFYLLIVFSPESALGQGWQLLTGAPLTFTFTGLVVASCLYSLPFVVQPLQAAFELIDRRVIEAAWTLGAGRVKTFFRIILPQARSGFVVAVILGFAHTIGEFGVVLMVGGNITGETKVISIAIYEAVETLDYPLAHALSAGMLLFSIAVLWLVYGLNQRYRIKVRL